MSFIGKKGRRVKSITSALKDVVADIKIIEERIGSKQLEEMTNKFTPVLLRYSEERGVNFCVDHNILELAREGRTPKEILFEKEWKHQAMLEDLLNFLTWRGVFRKKGREYHSVIRSKEESEEPIGLRPEDRKWIEDAKGYKVVFTLFDRILSRFVQDSIKTGSHSVTLDDRPAQLGPLMDSFFMNPSFTTPRMVVIAAAFKQAIPTKILDLNCGTGRGIEELLLFNANAEIVGVTDNLFHLRVAERNLAVFSDQKKLYPRIEWRVADFSQPLPNQLEDLVAQCDMVLINQLFQFCPHEVHQRLVEDILSFLKPGGVGTFFQYLRAKAELPWPHEWFYRSIQGFSGIPTESTFNELVKKENDRNVREIIPLTAYLVY